MLLVDVGNTTTRLALWRRGRVTSLRTAPTNDSAHHSRVAALVAPLAGPVLHHCEVVLCSVVPRAEAAWRNWARRQGADLFLVRGDTPTPLTNCYRKPATLGGDRLAAAVGAVNRLGAHVIVVSLGTAAFVDAVSANREFLGGAICPGVQTGLSALADNTAALPSTRAQPPRSLIGRDTQACLRSGAVHGSAALVEGLVQRFRQHIGPDAPLALTGGAARLIARCLAIEHHLFPTLTLEGLAAIWQHNQRRPLA